MEYRASLDYDVEKDDWEQFVERMEFYFIANNVTEEVKKRVMFLTKVSAKTYALIKKICAPQKPDKIALEDIIKWTTDYLKPKVNVTVLRSQFRRRMQGKDESAPQYIAALKELAIKCEFKDIDDSIKDQMITELLDGEARREALFKIEKLTLYIALREASAVEEAKKSVNTSSTKDQGSTRRGRSHKCPTHEKTARTDTERVAQDKFATRTTE